jgi:hypothetical protein
MSVTGRPEMALLTQASAVASVAANPSTIASAAARRVHLAIHADPIDASCATVI